jgi:hypothetical protein
MEHSLQLARLKLNHLQLGDEAAFYGSECRKLLREEALDLHLAADTLREGGLHVRTVTVRVPSDLGHPKREGHIGTLRRRVHVTCSLTWTKSSRR